MASRRWSSRFLWGRPRREGARKSSAFPSPDLNRAIARYTVATLTPSASAAIRCCSTVGRTSSRIALHAWNQRSAFASSVADAFWGVRLRRALEAGATSHRLTEARSPVSSQRIRRSSNDWMASIRPGLPLDVMAVPIRILGFVVMKRDLVAPIPQRRSLRQGLIKVDKQLPAGN